MNKALVIWNVVVTAMLAAMLFVKSSPNGSVRVAEIPNIVRATRIELIDQRGKMKAVLEAGGAASSNPNIVLYNEAGREAVILTINSKGYGTMYFQDKKTEGKLSIGYLWGSDTPIAPDSEDPLGSWGISVRGNNGTQMGFGFLNNGQPIPGRK